MEKKIYRVKLGIDANNRRSILRWLDEHRVTAYAPYSIGEDHYYAFLDEIVAVEFKLAFG